MTEKELAEELEEIQAGMHMLDPILNFDFDEGKYLLRAEQAAFIHKLFALFNTLRWQVSFNSYKELRYGQDKPIRYGNSCRPGTPVKVCPCAKRFGGKTYFGILVGDIATSISHSIDGSGVVTASHKNYNPAIIIPELGEVVFGYESWWGEITSKEELEAAITKEVTKDVWYIRMLNECLSPGEKQGWGINIPLETLKDPTEEAPHASDRE